MKCVDFKNLMDERLQLLAEDAEADRDWSALESHLADCDACAADWAELVGVRDGLGDLAGDGPTTEEVDAMWAAVETRAFGQAGDGAASMFDGWSKVMQSTPVRSLLATAAVIVFSVGVTVLMDGSTGAVKTAMVPDQMSREVRSALKESQLGSDGIPFFKSVGRNFNEAQDFADSQIADKRIGDLVESTVTITSAARGTYIAQAALSAGAASVAAGPRGGLPRAPSYTSANELSQSLDRFSAKRERVGSRPAMQVGASTGTRFFVVDDGDAGQAFGSDIAADSETLTIDFEPLGYAALFNNTDIYDPLTRCITANLRSSMTADGKDDEQPTTPNDTNVGDDAVEPTHEPVLQKIKVIKTGELELEVTSYADASQRVESIVLDHSGFVADATVEERAGGAMVGTLIVRVLPEQFEPLFAALKPIGRVGHEHVKAADVTAEWVDLEARIKGLLITEQRLQELVQNKSIIDKVSALLEVERELTRVRSNVEQLQGQLRVMADRVGLSTITVRLSEAERTVPKASFWIEVGDVQGALPKLNALVEQLGAKLTSTETTKRDDGTFKADNSLVVSLAKFGDLLSQIDSLGRVKHRIVKDWESADASAAWADEVRCDVGIMMHERSYQLPAGTMQVEVSTLADGMAALDTLLTTVDGAIANNTTRRNSDGSVSADLKLSVAAGRFADLVERLGTLGRTLNKTVAGEAGEITGGAAELPCELSLTMSEPAREVPSGTMTIEVEEFAAATDRLSGLVDADKLQVLGSSSTQRNDGTWMGHFRIGVTTSEMEDVVSAVEKLGRVTSRQVIGLGLGALSRMDKDALGVIELTLAEPAAMRPSPDRASGPIRKALSDGLAGLYASLALIVRAVITAAPWLVLAIAILFVLSRAKRRAKRTS